MSGETSRPIMISRPPLDLRQLVFFVVLAEDLNFTRASYRLGVAQPWLSQQIRRLERDIGVQLLKRTTRRVELTDAGRQLVEEGRKALAQAERAAQLARLASAGRAGALRIGYVTGALANILPATLRALHRRHPEISVELQAGSSWSQLSALNAHKIDVGFVRRTSFPGLAFEQLADDYFFAVLPAHHPLARNTEVPWAAITSEPLLFTDPSVSPDVFDRVTSLYATHGAVPRLGEKAADVATLQALVAADLGISIFLDIRDAIPDGSGVVYRRLIDPVASMPFAITWRRDDDRELVRTYLGIAREAARQRN